MRQKIRKKVTNIRDKGSRSEKYIPTPDYPDIIEFENEAGGKHANLYWYIMISRRADAQEFIDLCQKLEVPRLYCSLAHGTAKSQSLDLLGIEQSEKVVHQQS